MKKGIVKKLVIAVVAVAIVGVIASKAGRRSDEPKKVVSSDAAASSAAESSQGASKEVKTEFTVGETAELKGVKTTLVEVKESAGGDILKPAEGKIWVLPVFEIENGSGKEIAVSSLASFEAYVDGYAVNINISPLTEAKDGTLDGKIAAGKKMRGVLGYEVPENYKELEIRFKASLLGKEIIFKYAK